MRAVTRGLTQGEYVTFDLLIRNGTVIDGTGMPRFRADVGVVGRTIAKVGRIRERGRREIDAEGHFVTPGFIDGHTHLTCRCVGTRWPAPIPGTVSRRC